MFAEINHSANIFYGYSLLQSASPPAERLMIDPVSKTEPLNSLTPRLATSHLLFYYAIHGAVV